MPEVKRPEKVASKRTPPWWVRYDNVRDKAVTLGLLLLIIVVASSQNPDLGQHRKAWEAKVGTAITGGTKLGEMIGTQSFQYHNYIIFSTMTQHQAAAGDRTDSIGIFGHVYVCDNGPS